VTPAECRAARALVDIDRAQLSGLAVQAIDTKQFQVERWTGDGQHVEEMIAHGGLDRRRTRGQ
jgi:hypothetical protein